MRIRVLPYEEFDASINMGIDEFFLNQDLEKDTGIIRFYGWKNDTVSIGRFQGVKYEVDIDKCKDHKVDIVRRATGGGAVFHDNIGELTYSFITKEIDDKKDIEKSYIKMTDFIIRTLNRLNIKAEFKPLNDITVGGRKISGNAQTRKNGIILQHGTILLYVSSQRMFSYLKISDEKLKHKVIKSIPKLVVSISKFIPDITKEFLQSEFIKTLRENNTVEIMPITESELEIARTFSKKFASNEWTYSR